MLVQAEVDAEQETLADSQKNGYVNYLRMLTPLNRRNAIFGLAHLTWEIDNPKFLTHPQVSAAATARLALVTLVTSTIRSGQLSSKETTATCRSRMSSAAIFTGRMNY